MGAILSRLLQTIRFERDAYVWMDFNDRATGDALIFVAVTTLMLLLAEGESLLGVATSASGLNRLFSLLVSAAIFWLIYSGLLYAVVRFLFQAGDRNFALYLRFVGFGYPTLLLLIFTSRLSLSPFIEALLGHLWFLAVAAAGTMYASDLPRERAAGAAGLAFVGWVIVSAIFGGGIIF